MNSGEFEITPQNLVSKTAVTATAPKILVAEDVPELRQAIVMVLTEQGYHVQTASDGLEATVIALAFKPDLVILDMRMPRMSGSNACAIIRKTSDVPIIMFTSFNDASEVKDAIRMGATDFVLKSTGVSVLTRRVRFHLENMKPPPRNKTARNATTRNPVAATVRNQDATITRNPNRTTSLIVDPDAESRSVIKTVLTRLNQDVIEVNTGAEAIAAFKQIRPDILITEWSLPDMNAFDLLTELKQGKNIRRARKSRNLYKLLMSGRLSPEAHRRASYVGITKFLHKPLDSTKIETLIVDCVRHAMRNLRHKSSRAA